MVPWRTKRAPAEPSTRWAEQVFAEALQLSSRLGMSTPADLERHPHDREVLVETNRLIALAIELALRPPERSPRRRLHDWWTGSRIETCWAYLRDAEVNLAQIENDAIFQATALSALAHAHRLPEDDPARKTLTKLVELPS